MLALLVQLLAHRRVVALGLRQRVVLERVLLATLVTGAARREVARLCSHALMKRRVQLVHLLLLIMLLQAVRVVRILVSVAHHVLQVERRRSGI